MFLLATCHPDTLFFQHNGDMTNKADRGVIEVIQVDELAEHAEHAELFWTRYSPRVQLEGVRQRPEIDSIDLWTPSFREG